MRVDRSGLLGARATLDDRVDSLEVARVRDEPDADLPVRCRPRSVRRQVVLDVTRATLRVDRDRFDRPLAFELTEDVLVGHPDRVGEHVEPSAMRHPQDNFVSARFGGELDRLVEHRDHHVEALERELLLPEEALAQETLHPLHLTKPPVEGLLLLCCEGLPVPAGFDRLAKPDPLLMVGEVLELIGDRAGNTYESSR